MTIYLAGKITGNPDYETDFEAAERALTKAGESVMNPAILPFGWGWDSYMEITLTMMRECDVICMLPNWMSSRGARRELMSALAMGKRVMKYSDFIADGKVRFLRIEEAAAMLAVAYMRAEEERK